MSINQTQGIWIQMFCRLGRITCLGKLSSKGCAPLLSSALDTFQTRLRYKHDKSNLKNGWGSRMEMLKQDNPLYMCKRDIEHPPGLFILPFKGNWRQIAYGRVNPLVIVKSLDIFKDAHFGFFTRFIGLVRDEFLFYNTVKRINTGIIITVSFATHTSRDVVFLQQCSEVMRGILAPRSE